MQNAAGGDMSDVVGARRNDAAARKSNAATICDDFIVDWGAFSRCRRMPPLMPPGEREGRREEARERWR